MVLFLKKEQLRSASFEKEAKLSIHEESSAHGSLLDALYGVGHLSPGGADEIARLVRPIGLSAEHRLLLAGNGTGGALLSLTAEFGCRVEAANPSCTPGAFDHALALMPLGGADPALVLGAIAGGIKPGGHLVLLDIVAIPPIENRDDRMKGWLAQERRRAMPPDEAMLGALLKRLGFEICMVEDLTDRYQRLEKSAWQRYLQTLDRRPAPALASALISEAERMLARSALIQAGRLRLLRWHAIKGDAAGVDFGSIKLEIMLSVQFRDWRRAIALWETLSQEPGREEQSRVMRLFITGGISRDKRELPDEVRQF